MKILAADEWHHLAAAHSATVRLPLLVVLGPTASGKTDFSLDLAEKGASEIINADSRQLYRYLDIGTAKIRPEEMRGVPHHLLDVLDPREEVTIAWYKEEATRAIDAVHARGHVPILVGGSMLYISAVIDGLDPLPPPDPAVRARLEEEWDADDGWTLYDRLVAIDPLTAKNVVHQNKRYVVRALELYEKTGIPPSQLKKTIPPPYQTLIFGMHRPREQLVRRIEERTELLLRSGWIEEVEGLIDRGYTAADPGMKSHGYRELIQWLHTDERDRDALKEVINRKTRHYAKRQMTWWGNDERIVWVEKSD